MPRCRPIRHGRFRRVVPIPSGFYSTDIGDFDARITLALTDTGGGVTAKSYTRIARHA